MTAQEALSYLKSMVVEATCLDDDAFDAIASLAAALDEREQLQASLRVLLDWCVTFLNDDKHLIGSVCKEADDAQFRHAIEQARKTLERR